MYKRISTDQVVDVRNHECLTGNAIHRCCLDENGEYMYSHSKSIFNFVCIYRYWAWHHIYVLSVWAIGYHNGPCSAMASYCSAPSLGLHIWATGLGWSTITWMSCCPQGPLQDIVFSVSTYMYDYQGTAVWFVDEENYNSTLLYWHSLTSKCKEFYSSLIDSFEVYRYETVI